MASELQWVHQYCLTCDQQTDGATYCSESCRLADYEEATQFSPPTSGPGSPSWAPTGISTYPWSMGAPSARSRQLFTLTPNYDFQSAQSSKPAQPTSSLSLPPTTSTATTTVTYHHVLSPSSSQTSLSSMRSSTSSTSGALSALSAFANGSASQSSFSSTASTTTNTNDLSQRVRSELRKYASSLEQGRLQRQLQRRTSC